jgi:chromosome segregation protein
MGEQSAKHLRGKAMEDVIFAGSESRGPAPMAEVSLTFDDVGFSHEALELARHSDTADAERVIDGMVDEEAPEPIQHEQAVWVDAEGNPIASPQQEVEELLADRPPAMEFASYTEVTITRRLYRDGLSQYYINKTPCRLRDITDFFLGTGVGTKAYAIIEQGRIGQIVSARPQDRRTIIEEAAIAVQARRRQPRRNDPDPGRTQCGCRTSHRSSMLWGRCGRPGPSATASTRPGCATSSCGRRRTAGSSWPARTSW